MTLPYLNILLAEDDQDNRFFFSRAVNDIPSATTLKTVEDGEQLMQLLIDPTVELPHVLFLDLNMPRKNGFECLTEIKLNIDLKKLPVVIFSASFEKDMVNLAYTKGARYYIRKPAEISQFKNVIHQALILIMKKHVSQPAMEDFVLTGNLT